MNILLTSAGRRSYLVKYFKEALGKRGMVYVVNSTADATAMILADKAFVAPPLYEEGYIDFLTGICRKHDVDLLISLLDLELPVLAGHRDAFEEIGVKTTVSKDGVIAACNDKMKTMEFADGLDLKTLFTTTDLDEALERLNKRALDFPLYVKPRWGMGSIAMQQADTEEELRVLFTKVKRDIDRSYLKHYHSLVEDECVIIQEKARGEEYGLDVVNDLEGRYVTTFVKRKLGMRSGETDGAVTEDLPELRNLGRMIGTHLQHIGNLDIDLFWDGEEPVILEMNARLGGGYPFSHLAGANVPKAYIQWVENRPVSEECFTIEYGVKGFKNLDLLNFNQIKLFEE